MSRRTVVQSLWIGCLLLFTWTLSACGTDAAPDETDDSAGAEAAAEEPLLSGDEQRALRAEATLEADESITEENLDETFDALKKEIEADL